MLEKYNISKTTLRILGLYRSNYDSSFHLREIARESHADVKTAQLQLKKLERMNIIKSVRKGKNKEYSLNLSNYLTLYYLILAEAFASIEYLDRNFEIKKLVSETAEKMGKAAILFGSFVKGGTTEESDIDVLIIDDKKADMDTFQEVGKLIGREVSIKCVTEEQLLEGLMKGDPLMKEVIANHITLKGIDVVCNVMWRYYAKR